MEKPEGKQQDYDKRHSDTPRSDRSKGLIQAVQERENEDTQRMIREKEQREREEREKANAEQNGKTEKSDGGGGTQSEDRKEPGHPAAGRAGIQSGGQTQSRQHP